MALTQEEVEFHSTSTGLPQHGGAHTATNRPAAAPAAAYEENLR